MSFKNWTLWERGFVILGAFASLIVLIDFFTKKANVLIPVIDSLLEALDYKVSIFSVLLFLAIVSFLRGLIKKITNKNSEKQGVLPLNDDCEARYSYFPESGTINYIGCQNGFELYCSIHDLRLSTSPYGNEWLCPDAECTHQKRVGNHEFIISLIDRQIRQQNS